MIKLKKGFLYAERVILNVIRLPRTLQYLETSLAKHQLSLEEQYLTVDGLDKVQRDSLSKINRLETVTDQHSDISDAYARLDTRLTNLQHIITKSKDSFGDAKSKEKQTIVNNTVADNHSFDMFYKEFEDRFRGSENLIKARVSEHLELFTTLSPEVRKMKIVDIGCGRGEFLAVMKESGFNAHGVDMNGDMVKRAISQGLSAEEIDALSFLKKQPSSSVAAVTGFHIVEHIPFEPLMEIFQECYRSITKGGLVLFETPNPESLYVGASTFYTDPSHLRPIPPGLLAFMLEYSGFKTEILLLHKQHEDINTKNKYLARLYNTVYGYADYAVVGRKV